MKEINAAYDMLTGKAGGSTGGYSSAGGYSSSGQQNHGSQQVYNQIRMMIQAGNILEAERLLTSIPNRDAQWYYLMGVLYTRKGSYTQARSMFQTAEQMDPQNKEYRQAYDAFHSQGQGFAGRAAGGSMDQDQCCRICQCMFISQFCFSGPVGYWFCC